MNLLENSDLTRCLSEDEQQKYINMLSKGDKVARNQLIQHNVKLVYNIVHRKFLNSLYDYQELVSVGIVGLIMGIDTYNPSKGKFSTYVGKCIYNRILAFVKLESKHKNNVSISSVIISNSNGDEITLEEHLEDKTSLKFILDLEDKEVRVMIRNLVDMLPEKKKKIIILYFGFYGNRCHTQKEIADIMGISRSNVSTIISQIIREIDTKLCSGKYNEVSINYSEIEVNKVKKKKR